MSQLCDQDSPKRKETMQLLGGRDHGRNEKSWQRVPNIFLLGVLSFYLILGQLTQVIEDSMPDVVYEEDLPFDDLELNIFSEETGWFYLLRTVSDKPKVAGTPYHLKMTKHLKSIVDTIASDGIMPVKTDWQMASGDFQVNSVIHAYQNVSNIIAVLKGESGFNLNGTTRSSILINCHYDSVPSSPGASDNGVFCATMLATLSKLSRRRTPLAHNVVFLFNGAEENGLMGSHAFLQHPWAHGVVAVVNLDAAGMNGKPSVFQVSDSRVLSAYVRSALRPSAQSVSEVLFLSGLIPSDTDFRIWRDYGNIHGIDVAFTKWGSVYHTRHDDPKYLRVGVIQGAGEMLLQLVRTLAEDHRLTDKDHSDPPVYFDYLNQFILCYSWRVSVVVDLIAVCLCAASVFYYLTYVGLRWSSVSELLIAAVGRLVCACAGVATVAVFLPFNTATGYQLRYISHPWIVVAMYWVPYLIAAVYTAHVYDAWRIKKSGLNRLIRTLQAMCSARLLICGALCMSWCVPALSTARYVLSVPLLLCCSASFVSLTLVRFVRLKAWHHLMLELVLGLPAVMFTLMLSLRLNAVMLPIMGRTPIEKPDYLVAGLNLGLVILVAINMSGIELLFARRRLWMVLGPVFACCVIVMFKHMHPFLVPATQRHVWFHSEIKSIDYYNVEEGRLSAVVVSKQDAYSVYAASRVLGAANYTFAALDDLGPACDQLVYCNLPVYRPSIPVSRHLKDSLVLRTGPPAPFSPPAQLRLVNSECDRDTQRCTQQFVMTGAPHNLLTVSPRQNVSLLEWSLHTPPVIKFHHRGRPVYVVSHARATHSDAPQPFNFSLTFQVAPSGHNKPIVDLSHHSHEVQHLDHMTAEFQWITHAAASYFNLVPIMSFRTNYVF